jgi:Histidine phosphatase superfamily (branch 2)
MIIRLARHGARGPGKPNNFGLDWIGVKLDYDYGELIPIGYLQHYLSGVEVTLRYRNLFQEILQPDEYFLRASSKERTYNS